MSIATELTRLNGNLDALSDAKDDIASAITTKGGTVASGDGFEDFAADIASIPSGGGDPYEKLNDWFKKRIKVVVSREQYDSGIQFGTVFNDTQLAVCQYISVPNATFDATNYYIVGLGRNSGSSKKYTVIIGNKRLTYAGAFATSYIDTLVLVKRDSITLLSNDLERFYRFPSKIYVPPELLSTYKTATNWVNHSTAFLGYDEAPNYDGNTIYGIGDACKFNGRFYTYRTEDLMSSSGHAPSGTNSDNEYWEYIDEVQL